MPIYLKKMFTTIPHVPEHTQCSVLWEWFFISTLSFADPSCELVNSIPHPNLWHEEFKLESYWSYISENSPWVHGSMRGPREQQSENLKVWVPVLKFDYQNNQPKEFGSTKWVSEDIYIAFVVCTFVAIYTLLGGPNCPLIYDWRTEDYFKDRIFATHSLFCCLTQIIDFVAKNASISCWLNKR